MNKNLLIPLFALFMLSCAKQNEPQGSDLAIKLAYNDDQTASRVDALATSDQIGVFCALDGTESYTLRNALFTVGTDGKTLETSPAPYYPDPKRTVNFYAYLPYQAEQTDASKIAFSVPTDQTSALALKSADLLWGSASSAPVDEAVPIVFNHLMARVIVELASTQAVDRVTIVGAVVDGRLNVSTGAFALGSTAKSVSSTNNEFIIPAQLLPRLIISVSGVDYVFENTSSLTLTAAATNTLSLTLNPITQTATLANPTAIVSPWLTANKADEVNRSISNTFTMHYAPSPTDYTKANKVTLTVQHPVSLTTQDIDLSPSLVSAQSSASACSYTFPMELPTSSGIPYPYTITRVRLYFGATLLRDTPQKFLKGSSVYRTGNQTLAHYITIKVRDQLTNTTDIVNWKNIVGGGEQLLTKVTIEGLDATWIASASTEGLNVTASGVSGAVSSIAWNRNPSTTAGRSGSVTFETVPSCVSLTIPTNQFAQATPPNTVLINGVAICTGNLVANGANGCKIGSPTDHGLYFQLGSLVGWSGGENGDGTGQGLMTSVVEAKVQPSVMKVTPSWIIGSRSSFTTHYFSYSLSPWDGSIDNNRLDIGGFSLPMADDSGSGNLQSGRYATIGIGDPCTYYLGAAYRSPTGADFCKLLGDDTRSSYAGDWSQTKGWVWSAGGAYHTGTSTLLTHGAGMIVGGVRKYMGSTGYLGGASVHQNGGIRNMFSFAEKGDIGPLNGMSRIDAFPARCVAK